MHTKFCSKKSEGKGPLARPGHRWEDSLTIERSRAIR
jgi:hypothetical protein